MKLDILTYNKVLRDALCLRFKETEEGRKYLRDCWRFQQEDFDISAINKYQKLSNKGGV